MVDYDDSGIAFLLAGLLLDPLPQSGALTIKISIKEK